MVDVLTATWHWISLGLIVVIVLAIVFLTRPVRVAIRVVAFIIDLGSSYGRNAGTRKGIVVSGIKYRCGDQDIVADLYRPGDNRRHSGVMLAHGAVAAGKDDRAMKFAGETLARAGFVVLVPQLDNLTRFRLHQDDVEGMVDGFQYLSRQKFCNGRIGMFGVCLSAPLVLLAATYPAISRKLAVIVSWGGFYNINDWMQDILKEQYVDGGGVKSWKPRSFLVGEAHKWLIELMPDASDRVRIAKMLAGSVPGSANGDLSPSGQAMYELITNTNPERVADLWVRLDPRLQQTLDSLSFHGKAHQLKTKIAIIHSINDDVVPWVESVKLANAITAESIIYFKIFRQFYHASIEDLLRARISNLRAVVSEIFQFYFFVYHILYRL